MLRVPRSLARSWAAFPKPTPCVRFSPLLRRLRFASQWRAVAVSAVTFPNPLLVLLLSSHIHTPSALLTGSRSDCSPPRMFLYAVCCFEKPKRNNLTNISENDPTHTHTASLEFVVVERSHIELPTKITRAQRHRLVRYLPYIDSTFSHRPMCN
jgi:hypothetical protein